MEIHHAETQNHHLDDSVDVLLIENCKPALENGEKVHVSRPVYNTQRTVGGMLAGEFARRYGSEGLPDGTVQIDFEGVAGQSYGAWLTNGLTFTLKGTTNDYVGKGLSGGRLAVYPHEKAAYTPEESIVVGNVALYGATSGEAFFRGYAGERFAVRNSGARTVVEGVGDHGCEYMTGGVVVVLGSTGRNFAAGMSGGVAFIFDEEENFRKLYNPDMVGLEAVESDEDVSLLQGLLERHLEWTGSEKAQRILEDWDDCLSKFIKVMPNDLKRIMGREQRRANGGGRLVGDPRGFLKIGRKPTPKRPIEERIHDYQYVYEPMPEDDLKDQAARCMDCGVPFCNVGCPLGNLIPDWNDLVYKDHWKQAIDRLHATNNFPEFTGMLCPAPCEDACVLAINDDSVTIKEIELSIIDRAFEEGWGRTQAPAAGDKDRQEGRGRGQWTGGARGGTTAKLGRAHGNGLREERPHRRAPDVWHPGLQDREVGRGSPGRDHGARRHRVPAEHPRRPRHNGRRVAGQLRRCGTRRRGAGGPGSRRAGT